MIEIIRVFWCSFFIIFCTSTLGDTKKVSTDSILLEDVDQVVLSEEGLFLIRLNPLSIQKWEEEACLNQSFTKQSVQIAQNLESNLGSKWTSVILSNKPTFPIYWTKGQFKNHLVIDRTQKSIWQLDKEYQVLSRLLLPKELEFELPEQYQMFWLEGRRVLFVNPSLGIAHQYIQKNKGWWHHSTNKIPLGYEKCYLGCSSEEKNCEREFVCMSAQKISSFDIEWNLKKQVTWERKKYAVFKTFHPRSEWRKTWISSYVIKYQWMKSCPTYSVSNSDTIQIEKSFCHDTKKSAIFLCP